MLKMKKILVLLVVLGFVSAASAGVIDISITSLNGNQIAPVKEITIAPSDTIDMQLVWTGPTNLFLFSLTAILNQTGPGTLDMAGRLRNSAMDASLGKIGTVAGTGQQWIVEAASNTGPAGLGTEPVTIVSNLLLHCDGPGVVTIVLSDYAPGGGSMEVNANFDPFTPTYGNGIVIHQIPEPMTLMLLGLGSLFLVRRKK
jgi:hypothetical protein